MNWRRVGLADTAVFKADGQQTTSRRPRACLQLGNAVGSREKLPGRGSRKKKDTGALIPELPGCALKLTQRRNQPCGFNVRQSQSKGQADS